MGQGLSSGTCLDDVDNTVSCCSSRSKPGSKPFISHSKGTGAIVLTPRGEHNNLYGLKRKTGDAQIKVEVTKKVDYLIAKQEANRVRAREVRLSCIVAHLDRAFLVCA